MPEGFRVKALLSLQDVTSFPCAGALREDWNTGARVKNPQYHRITLLGVQGGKVMFISHPLSRLFRKAVPEFHPSDPSSKPIIYIEESTNQGFPQNWFRGSGVPAIDVDYLTECRHAHIQVELTRFQNDFIPERDLDDDTIHPVSMHVVAEGKTTVDMHTIPLVPSDWRAGAVRAWGVYHASRQLGAPVRGRFWKPDAQHGQKSLHLTAFSAEATKQIKDLVRAKRKNTYHNFENVANYDLAQEIVAAKKAQQARATEETAAEEDSNTFEQDADYSQAQEIMTDKWVKRALACAAAAEWGKGQEVLLTEDFKDWVAELLEQPVYWPNVAPFNAAGGAGGVNAPAPEAAVAAAAADAEDDIHMHPAAVAPSGDSLLHALLTVTKRLEQPVTPPNTAVDAAAEAAIVAAVDIMATAVVADAAGGDSPFQGAGMSAGLGEPDTLQRLDPALQAAFNAPVDNSSYSPASAVPHTTQSLAGLAALPPSLRGLPGPLACAPNGPTGHSSYNGSFAGGLAAVSPSLSGPMGPLAGGGLLGASAYGPGTNLGTSGMQASSVASGNHMALQNSQSQAGGLAALLSLRGPSFPAYGGPLGQAPSCNTMGSSAAAQPGNNHLGNMAASFPGCMNAAMMPALSAGGPIGSVINGAQGLSSLMPGTVVQLGGRAYTPLYGIIAGAHGGQAGHGQIPMHPSPTPLMAQLPGPAAAAAAAGYGAAFNSVLRAPAGLAAAAAGGSSSTRHSDGSSNSTHGSTQAVCDVNNDMTKAGLLGLMGPGVMPPLQLPAANVSTLSVQQPGNKRQRLNEHPSRVVTTRVLDLSG